MKLRKTDFGMSTSIEHGGFTGFWSRYIPKINERNMPIVEVDNFCSTMPP